MPKIESLDDLIAKKAVEYADQIKAAASMAANEEEIRIESEKQLAFIQKDAGVKLEGKHEFTVASGRVDSVYSRVIIEYKNPKSPGDRIGPKSDSPGSKKVVEQIKKRFYDMRTQHGQPLNSLFGVGLDGNHFIFIRFRDEKWQVQEPVEVNRHSAERFLWALFNLGNKGKPFSPEYLAGDFGSEGGNTVAIAGIHALYDAIVTTGNPKAQTFFSQWKILFGEVCGYDVDNPSDKIKKLADFYQVGVKNLKPAELLFAVHTYYALFMKLLASEIVAFFHKLPTPLQKMMQAGTSAKLKREMDDLEAGSIFRHLNITNFLEGDLFAWYAGVWTEPIEKLVRDMVARLDNYNPGTLSEDPAGSRDLLKKLYQQLFPKSVRHDLGEYYTPDWLADHVLNELGYAGDPDKRLLDPACGSGTFLVMTINRIRQWYDENREKCRFDEGELCRKILSNIIGFDLNPLAVMAARTNYLIAIRDLIGRMDKVELPVYLCDSILTPAEYGDLFTGKLGKAKELKTAAARFLIPVEIAHNREAVGKYAEQLEFCVKNGFSAKEFIQRCQDEGLSVSAEGLHSDLYRELVRLDKANKNGVWARIIKNAFAPLFISDVDYVAGNPPWVNWESLPSSYRSDTQQIWRDYGLFTLSAAQGRMGGGKKDLSVLFLYTSIDRYLKIRGRLGFVITQTIFQTTGAGEGFRNFSYSTNGATVHFAVKKVNDMVKIKPFENAANWTATITCEKGAVTEYPVDYVKWETKGEGCPGEDMPLEEVISIVARSSAIAQPSSPAQPNSVWIVSDRKQESAFAKMGGRFAYKIHEGTNPGGAVGVYWLQFLRSVTKTTALFENQPELAKKVTLKQQAQLETELVFPHLRWGDVSKWCASPSNYILVPQDFETRCGIDTPTMKRAFPKAYAYLLQFKQFLLARTKSVPKDPFYSMLGVSTAALAKFKVVWRALGERAIKPVVVEWIEDKNLDRSTPVLCQWTCYFISTDDRAEAHFVCGLLSSSLLTSAIKARGVSGGKNFGSSKQFANINFPRFDSRSPTHRLISTLSEKCHAAAKTEERGRLAQLEKQIDDAAAELWGICKKK